MDGHFGAGICPENLCGRMGKVRRIVDAGRSFIEGLDARNPDLESSDEEID